MTATPRAAAAAEPLQDLALLPAAAACFAARWQMEAGWRLLRLLAEEARLAAARPVLATPNRVVLALRTLRLRDYGGEGMPTIVAAPYAGHTAAIADHAEGQSLVRALRAGGAGRVLLIDWRSATPDMACLEIDDYLAELDACVAHVGGRANVVGLCQGGWLSAMYAARFPERVASLVLAGSPIDTEAGDGPLKRLVNATPTAVFAALVAAGGGLMRGQAMLMGWKGLHPSEHLPALKRLALWGHLDDPDWLRRNRAFTAWYETTLDLPGRWYLQAIVQLFKENRLARGEFVALGRRISLAEARCPAFLIAGAEDDITPPDQVFAARALLGAAPGMIESRLVPGGHIGLFMGSRTLRETWPEVAAWIGRVGR